MGTNNINANKGKLTLFYHIGEYGIVQKIHLYCNY